MLDFRISCVCDVRDLPQVDIEIPDEAPSKHRALQDKALSVPLLHQVFWDRWEQNFSRTVRSPGHGVDPAVGEEAMIDCFVVAFQMSEPSITCGF